MEFELPKINVSAEYDKEKDEIVFVINGVEKRVKTADMITEMEKLHEQNTTLEQEPCEDAIDRAEAMTEIMMFAGNVKSDEEDIYIKVSDAVQLLRELPPITPKPKTDVLDKIIAEIDEKISHYEHFSSSNTANGLMIAKKIIDKYKAEKE